MARFFAGLARLAMGTELPVQVAAVCYRLNGPSVEFLLVNTSSGKWTFPKGRLCPSLSPSEKRRARSLGRRGVRAELKRAISAITLIPNAHWDTILLPVKFALLRFFWKSTGLKIPRKAAAIQAGFSAHQARKRLAEGRPSPYSSQIAKMIDAAVDRLAVKSRKQAEILMRMQGRRRLALSAKSPSRTSSAALST